MNKNKNKSRLAVACAAIVAAASAVVAAGPAQAVPTMSQAVSATFSTGAMTLNAVEHCETDEKGNTTNCKNLTLEAPAHDIVLSLAYDIASGGSATVLPAVISRTGTKGCQSIDSTGKTIYRTGVTLLAGPGSFTSGEREVKINGERKHYQPGSKTTVTHLSQAVCVPVVLAS